MLCTHYSTLAWKIPWKEEPGRLQSLGSQESDMTEQLHFTCSYSKFSESINMGSSEANRKYRKRLVLKLEKYELCITLE